MKKGRIGKTAHFLVRFLPTQKKTFETAIVVSSKKVKKAVLRNRIRRRVRALLALTLPEHGSPCYDVVVFASEKFKTAPFEILKKELSYLFSRLSHAHGK